MEFNLPSAISVLERTPATLRSLLGGLSTEWTDATEGGDTWSPFTIVGHLVHGERTDWMARAALILSRDPVARFAQFDRFAQFEESRGKSLELLLEEFAVLRAGNLKTVAGWEIGETELALTGEHPNFGPVTLRQLLATWTAHDLSHLAQIARVMARQYREAIGPWREYMPIMDR